MIHFHRAHVDVSVRVYGSMSGVECVVELQPISDGCAEAEAEAGMGLRTDTCENACDRTVRTSRNTNRSYGSAQRREQISRTHVHGHQYLTFRWSE